MSSSLSQQVQDSSDVIKEGRVRVVFNVPHEPQLEPLIQNQHVRDAQTLLTQKLRLEDLYVYCTYLHLFILYVLEILCEVPSRLCFGISSWHHQLSCLALLRKHLHWQRL